MDVRSCRESRVWDLRHFGLSTTGRCPRLRAGGLHGSWCSRQRREVLLVSPVVPEHRRAARERHLPKLRRVAPARRWVAVFTELASDAFVPSIADL